MTRTTPRRPTSEPRPRTGRTRPSTGDRPPDAEQPWRRLAPGMLLVEPVREIIKFIPMLIVLVFAGRAGDSGPPWGLIGTAAVIALGISRWLTTRYRITPTVVEVRRGSVAAQAPDRAAGPGAHRRRQRPPAAAGAAAGQGRDRHRHVASRRRNAQAGRPARRDRRAAARRTAASGADRPGRHPAPAPTPTGPSDPTGPSAARAGRTADDSETVLARLEPALDRLRAGHPVRGGDGRGADRTRLADPQRGPARSDPDRRGRTRRCDTCRARRCGSTSLQVSALVIVAVTVLSVAGYVLSFWGFRLTRHAQRHAAGHPRAADHQGDQHRGTRLHGVDRSEPLLLRLVGGARLQAIATGLRSRGSERGSALLVPPAPLATVVAVESAVLGSTEPVAADAHRRTDRPRAGAGSTGQSGWPRCWSIVAVRALPGSPTG